MAELRDYTSLRVGGPAQKFVEVGTESEIIAAIEAAGDAPILIMGGGTNLLIADSGFAGVVIRITNHSLHSIASKTKPTTTHQTKQVKHLQHDNKNTPQTYP